MKYRNYKWLREEERRRKEQGPGRRFHVWRWERQVMKGCKELFKDDGGGGRDVGGDDWEELASDKIWWQSQLSYMATWKGEHA